MATFFIMDVYRITGIGAVPVGKVESGVLRVGMKANIDGKTIEIKSIEKNHEQVKEAQAGDNIGMNIKLINPISSAQQNVSFFKKLFAAPVECEILKKYAKKSIEFY